MGIETMGRVTVTAKIENLSDLFLSETGRSETQSVRSLTIDNALVDTGASTLSLPKNLVDQLGLRRRHTKQSMIAAGPRESSICDAVKLTIQDRYCTVDVLELPEGCPVLVGQIPLEAMDWVVELKGQQLIGNPAHGGEWTWEVY